MKSKRLLKKNASSNEVEIKNDLNVDLKSSNNSLIIEERKLKAGYRKEHSPPICFNGRHAKPSQKI